MTKRILMRAACAVLGGVALAAAGPSQARASDHGDAPLAAQDLGADIGDVYLFLNPNDNTKLDMLMTVHGFVAPAENQSFGSFDPTVKFRFAIENTGDASPDMYFEVTFAPRVSSTVGQVATVRLVPSGQSFSARATASSSTAVNGPAAVVTTDPTTGIKFFAGLRDDPFFFDLVAFDRFTDSVKAGSPDPSVLTRGRDSFAGYNISVIGLEVPVSMVRGAASNHVVGMFGSTLRRHITLLPLTTYPTQVGPDGTYGDNARVEQGKFRQIDRAGNPAINVVAIPFNKKDSYNKASPEDDAAGMFAPDIVASLKALGTNTTFINGLASFAVTHGDYIRVDLNKPNTGNGGGTNAPAAYPNGRRLGDDVIDTLLTFINNGNTLGDNVNANDAVFGNDFPFVAPAHQPLAAGVIDDKTRN